VPAIVDRDTGAVLMLVDDWAEAETIVIELRHHGVHADVVEWPRKGARPPPDEGAPPEEPKAEA